MCERVSLLLLTLLLAACGGAVRQPIDQAGNRATPLAFGTRVTPDSASNPITPPERFSGTHVGLDFEISRSELEADVSVYAICDGDIVYGGFAEGYGGLVVQRCTLAGEDVTVLYGHLSLESLPAKGSRVAPGERIAVLGAARSRDTDGNRKHLHLGIHRGPDIDERGYVQTEDEMAEFMDPASVLPGLSIGGALGPTIEPYWATASGGEL